MFRIFFHKYHITHKNSGLRGKEAAQHPISAEKHHNW